MSDFTFSEKKSKASNSKIFDFAKATKKQGVLSVKLALFIATFAGMTYLSLMNNGLMLKELLLSGGIIALLFFVHIVSNK